MKIGIDARFYAEFGGIGRYVRELIKQLEKIDTLNEYVIFVNQEGHTAYQPTSPNFKKILADIPWYGWSEQLFFPSIIKKQKIDLMHFPHWNVPLLYNNPFVVTIHDLILLHFPSRRASTLGWMTYKIKNMAYQLVIKHAVTKAKNILVPSKFVKEDIEKEFKNKNKKITVTTEGIIDLPHLNSFTKGAILKKNNIQKPYLLYVGVAYPHKNLEGLIEAFKIFQNKYSPNHQLVLAGKINYFYRQLQQNTSTKYNPDIIFADYVSDTELVDLYQNACAYIFPSFYEGFGLPSLEAIAQGLPIAVANSSCLPEILGSAALYFNPRDKMEMAEVMHRLINDQTLRQELKSRGQEQIKLYSWQNCAQLTLQTYLN